MATSSIESIFPGESFEKRNKNGIYYRGIY